MNFLFAWRYFRAKKSTNAINIIAWISIVAIMFGTAALILVLSVFNGFEGLVQSLYSSVYPELRISSAQGKQITLTQEQLKKINSVAGIKAVSLTAEEKGLLWNGDLQSIVYLKGVDENYSSITDFADHVYKGKYDLGDATHPLLILGAGVENAVGVQSDRNIQPLVVYMPRKVEVNVSDPLQSVNADTVNTSGAFIIQQEFDNKYAVSNLGFVKRILEMGPDTYTTAELSLKKNTTPEKVQQNLQQLLGNDYKVQTRYEQNQSLYSVMRTEKWFIYAILSLILVVAAFNMIGALTMLVLEKKEDISVLNALGATKSFVQRIFLSEGILLSVIGGGIGMLLALILSLLQIKYHFIPLQGETFLINYFPVKLKLFDFILVGVTVFVIAIIASLIPARKAAQQQFMLRSE
ncbi:MAG: ABC transporter permease [Chitinophagaceae bacterium]